MALNRALHILDAMLCPCGCNQHVDIAHDEDLAHRWGIEVITCYAGQALHTYREEHKDDMEPGMLLAARLLAEGETLADPLVFDPARAAEEYRKHMASIGAPIPD